jgi:kelch-like protein 12
MSSARGFAAATTIGERVYIVGGYDGQTELGTCEAFDLAAAADGEDPWHVLADMPEVRAGHAATAALGHLYVLGGGWQTPFTTNVRYDVANDVWGTIASPVTGEWRTLGAATVDTSSGLFVYAFGGWHGTYLSEVQAYQAFYRLYLP